MPPVWRDSVQVVLRIRTSISPEARIVGRSLALIGRYFTLFGSLKIAAAIALHSSTSRPLYMPSSSGRPKPARPGLAPQINWPRVLTLSNVPALADRAPTTANAAPASQAKCDRMTISSVRRTLWALAQDDWGIVGRRGRKSIGCQGPRSMLGNGPNRRSELARRKWPN